MYTKQIATASYKKIVIIIIAFIMSLLALSIKASADYVYIYQSDYPILKQDSSAYKSLMDHNKKSKNGHIYLLSVESTGNLSMDDYRKNKFKDLNLESNDMLITYAFNDGERNVGITTGSQVRSYLSDKDAIAVLHDNIDNLKSNDSDALRKGLFKVVSKYETYQDQQGKGKFDRLKKIIYKIFYVLIVVVVVCCAILFPESDPDSYDYNRSRSYSSDSSGGGGDTGGGSI